MKITKVVIRRFKRFEETEFSIPDDGVVVAGPNNCGKTTLLQAVAAWSLALARWRELNDYHRHRGAYAKAPLARQAFYPVPLRAFDWLWYKRSYRGNIEIELVCNNTAVTVEIMTDSSEQVYVRPRKDVDLKWLKQAGKLPEPVFVPAMSGLSTDEPVYQKPKIDQLLGQSKPGEVLRNLLVETSRDQDAWERLTESIGKMFGYELLPPNTDGPSIIAEYQHRMKGARFDIASAGSGFLQVLMLLTFLHSRQGSVLLLDEPDAHLHVVLQDGIYSEIRRTAKANNSQLIIATHSERMINAVETNRLCVLLDQPRLISGKSERSALGTSLGLENVDIMLAHDAPGVLYVEGWTDMEILRAWAEVLGHRLLPFLRKPFWKSTVSRALGRGVGIHARNHFEALKLVRRDVCGMELRDSDGKRDLNTSAEPLDNGLMRMHWWRYEIESYLIHSQSICRVVEDLSGQPVAAEKARRYLSDNLPPAVCKDPLGEHDYLKATKAKSILSAVFQEAGIGDVQDYSLIAATMSQDEIHPEVVEKLDAIAGHFGIPLKE